MWSKLRTSGRLMGAVVLLFSGFSCQPQFRTATVSGRVTLNGTPLPKATIGFEPVAPSGTIMSGPGSYGVTDENGQYQLTSLDRNKRGALVGKHRVWIRTLLETEDPDGKKRKLERPELLPERFHDATELTFEVPRAGTTQANFDLVLTGTENSRGSKK
ncbi:hypothetical protein SH661x_002968 [Planctomicrobium sp. SH661]|uniref:hypothetical protein n=1 Tax=Planctomicrobium sp. SH661 TaxID=3448124 RepID=UPI003F5BE1D8